MVVAIVAKSENVRSAEESKHCLLYHREEFPYDAVGSQGRCPYDPNPLFSLAFAMKNRVELRSIGLRLEASM